MSDAVTNTSPLLYLHRIGAIDLLSGLFDLVLVPPAVVQELDDGRARGYDVPDARQYEWLTIVEPQQVPSEWFALDFGRGEIAAMALALENPTFVVLLDDAPARRLAEAAGLSVWGTLRVLLTAKERRLIRTVSPFVDRLQSSGMWISSDIRERILRLAGEA